MEECLSPLLRRSRLLVPGGGSSMGGVQQEWRQWDGTVGWSAVKSVEAQELS